MTLGNFELFERLGVALALGLLIGLERGWQLRALPEGHRVAGFRTFALISLLGGVAALPLDAWGPIWLGVMAGAVALVLTAGYWRGSANREDISATSVVAALLTFALGALAGRGELTVAASSAVVVTLLLGFKPELHHLLRRIQRDELVATLRLLLISVVLLPILPNRGFGPWSAFNPYQVWWLVVLVASVSYVGYFAIKLIGLKGGVLVTALLGGMVSSTAIAVSLARRGANQPEKAPLFSAGVIISSAIMFPRMLLVAGIAAPALVVPLATLLMPPALVAAALAAPLTRSGSRRAASDTGVQWQPRNPLELRTALGFGLFLVAMIFFSHAASNWIGARGLYLLGALSGLVDVDAITLSLATMWTRGGTSKEVAVAAIAIAAAVNTLVKPILVAAISGPQMGWRVGGALVVALIGGAGVFWLGQGF